MPTIFPRAEGPRENSRHAVSRAPRVEWNQLFPEYLQSIFVLYTSHIDFWHSTASFLPHFICTAPCTLTRARRIRVDTCACIALTIHTTRACCNVWAQFGWLMELFHADLGAFYELFPPFGCILNYPTWIVTFCWILSRESWSNKNYSMSCDLLLTN